MSVDETWLNGKAVIAGIGHTAYGARGEFESRGVLSLSIEAISRACDDAGINPKQVDGWCSYFNDDSSPAQLADAFGCEVTNFTSMAWGGGGGASSGALLAAAMAVATGQAKYVILHRGICQAGIFRFGQSGARNAVVRYPEASFTAPFGQVSPAHMFSLIFRRHMHMYGTSIETLAEIAISTRANAVNNPNARFRTPLTLNDYMNSRKITDVLRLFDCCLESDGAGALLITSPERARDLKRRSVYIGGAAVGAPYRWGMGMMTSPTMSDSDLASAGQRTVAEHLYGKSGLGPDDVDVALIYDHFTPMVALGLEDFQFCKKGEVKDFVKDGRIRMDGAVPLNPHGGNLSEVYLHGITHYIEAVRQLRGTAINQVKDAEVALVVAGATMTPTSASILYR